MKHIVFIICCTMYATILSAQSTPDQLSDLAAWWSADSIEANNGDAIETWTTNNNEFMFVSQPEANSQPSLQTNIINGHPVVHFDGVDDYFDGGNILSIHNNGQTIFFIGKSITETSYFISKTIAANNYNKYALFYDNKIRFEYVDEFVNYIEGDAPINNFFMATNIINPEEGLISLYSENKFQESTTIKKNYDMTSSFNFILGGYNNSLGTVPPAGYLNGDIAEIIIYDRPLTQLERQDIENYLRLKYFPSEYRPPVDLGADINETYSLEEITLTVPPQSYYEDYVWNTGETTASITVEQSGTYWGMVTDDWGYVYYDTVEVQKPDIYSKPDTTICAGDSFVWDCGLAGAYTYTWSTGESSQAITIDQAGTYWVRVEDSFGNTQTSDTINVSVSTFADDATLGADTSLCEGNKLELIKGKADAVDYLWSTGSTEAQLDITAGGEYSVIAKDIYGCTLYDTIQVDFKGIAPVVRIEVSDLCIHESTRYENTTMPSDGSSVAATDWIFGLDTLHGFVANRPNSAAGNLTLRVITHTDVGCLGVLDTTITIGSLPQSSFSPPRACTQNTTQFMNTGSVEYDFIENSIWEINGDFLSGNFIEYEFDTAGIYPVSLQSISNYGCIHDTVIDIEVRPSALVQFAYGKTCQGERMHFFDKTEYEPHNSAVDGHWYVNSVQYPQYKTFGVTFNNPSTYVIGLEVTTINGCTGYTADTITVFPAPQFDSLRIYGCNNQKITLQEYTETFGQNIISYTWNIDSLGIRTEPEPMVVFKEIGNYNFTLEVETDKGCIGEAPGTIFVEEPPQAHFEFYPEFGAAPLEVDLTNTSIGAVDYEWLFEGYYESTEANPTHEFTMRDTSYARLVARSQYGCVDTVTYHIPVDLADQHIELLDIRYHENEQGFLEYTISVANTGNTSVYMIEFIIENPDYPPISETWKGKLTPGNLLEYTCSARLQKTNDKVPAYFCITGNLISQDVYRVYDSDTLCKDFTRQFSLYSIAPSPATEDVISVSFGINTPGDCTIEFFDATGQICIKKTYHNLTPGVYKKEINIYKLHSGIYTVTLSQDNKQEVRAISVIK